MVNFDAAFSDLEGGHSVNPHPIFQSFRLGALPTSGHPVRKLPYMRSQRLTDSCSQYDQTRYTTVGMDPRVCVEYSVNYK